MTFVIGVDGGGTHTRAVLLDETLRDYAQVEGPASNPSAQGWDATAQVIRDLIRALLDQAARPARDVAAIGVGLAGLTTDRDAGRLRRALASTFPDVPLILSWDLEIALIGAHGRRAGIMLVAGTGSGACGIGANGALVRVGGWGYLIGDEGSGFFVGSGGLRAVMLAHDGRGPQTILTERLLAALKLDTPEALIAWLYGQPVQPKQIAALAPLVCQAARDGDPVADAIIIRAVDDLLEMVAATLRGMKLDAAPLAVMGGLLTAPESCLGTRFRSEIARRMPQTPLVEPQHPPVIGAAIMALEALQEKGKER